MDGRNSKIILSKDINLDKSYNNVLNYTEQQMLQLCLDHVMAQDNHMSFIRTKNEINVDFSYATCLQCNYMAFQNPDYSNKWFFAFIDSCEYVGENTTKIRYTIDEHSTWFDYWDAKACLVIREHVRNDTIGLHTYPEGLETGDYICNDYLEVGGFSQATSRIVVATTYFPSGFPNIPAAQIYGGVFSGVYLVAFDSNGADAKKFIQALDGFGRGDAIQSVFMAPASLCQNTTVFSGTLNSKINNMDGTTSPHAFEISGYYIGNTLGDVIILQDYNVSLQQSLNGYTPKNNKLLCHPFNTLLLTNATGNTAEFHYEDFINNTPIFNIMGTLCPGCSIKMYPENYKKIGDGISTRPGFTYGIMAPKFPICSWNNDAFTNWMTQQSVNHTTMFFEEALSLGTGALSGGEFSSSDIGLGGGNFYQTGKNYMNQVYQHALVSPQQKGSLNGSDVAYGLDEMNFSIYKMSIKAEYAKMCDDYLTKYGYRINEIKIPDMLSRVYWNYLQIGKDEDIGYSNSLGSVPSSSMEVINNIYRRGTTIWHNHANVGNYSLNNTIVS